MIKEYRTIQEISGPLVVINNVRSAAVGELAEIELPTGERRRCRIVEIDESAVVVQLFENTDDINLMSSTARFLGRALELAVSGDMLGRVFNGIGEPIDNGLPVLAEANNDINGFPVNPVSRESPDGFIETGISVIDGLIPLVKGQRLPIFSCPGLPHEALAARIACQASLSDNAENFAVVFAAIGITFDEYDYFMREFNRTGVIDRAVVFANLAGDPASQRIATPRMALTTAEYLAFEKDMHVLVVLTDMTNYADALREISGAAKETPGRQGYPGYMHSDFSSIYERAGRRVDKSGSITMIPILTMPGDDKTHPVPDVTGYITDGQTVLSRELYKKGVAIPVDVLRSQSRFRDSAIGQDHADVTNQLLRAYAEGSAEFAKEFERRYLTQRRDEYRTIEDTLEIGRELLSILT
ncbi:MAG: V-type ATP synthase subunit B [Oscillospiraceae bacterium]|nr:V-type ATP synthase subunit B [Oscillospiraceae bacterium]